MSEVFYRKWRPRTLAQVVGQDAITQTLRNAVAQDRIAHAYLFCGPRGTGKTSTARILAKATNCKFPIEGEPDDECDTCEAIDQGRSLDVIEIDAASNRGIDDMRSLREKVHFTPNASRHKVYIIDEVHMLTESAFNALLKTLEEPPGHAIFVLATTEAHKVPLTIISRCQRFDFKRISNDATVDRLAKLCADERVETTVECLGLIARAATGSLRDAENLLEQAVVSYGSPLTEDSVVDLLGVGNDHRALDLVGHVVDRNTKEGLTLINQVVTDGADIRQFRRVITEYMRDVMLLKAGTGTSTGYSEDIRDRMCEIADRASLEHLVSALKMFINTDSGLDSASPVPLELAIVESSIDVGVDPRNFVAEVTSGSSESNDAAATVLNRSAHLEHNKVSRNSGQVSVTESVDLTSSQQQVKHQSSQDTAIDTGKESTNEPGSIVTEVVQTDAVNDDSLEGKWEEVLKLLNRQKGRRFNLGALMRVSVGRDVSDGLIELKYSHASHRERMRQELEDPKISRLVGDVIETVLGKSYDIRISEGGTSDNFSEVKPAQKSHIVRAAIALGAQISGEKENKKS